MVYRKAAVGVGALFCVLGFVFLLVAVCTNAWVEIQVKRENLDNSAVQLAHLKRLRGLFLECFDEPGVAMPLIEDNPLRSDDGRCIRTDFAANRGVAYSSETKMRAGLLIAMVVFFILALVLILFAFGVFTFSLCLDARVQPRRWSLAVKWAGILLFVAAFANAGGMAFFHGAEFLETQKITANDAEAPYPYYFRLSQSTVLQEATSRFYYWSYALSWLAAFFLVLSALILFMAGACCQPKSEKMMYEASTMNSVRSFGHRNRAYEYAEGKMPPAIINAPPQVIAEGPMYYDHFRGPHFDPYSRRTNPPEIMPQSQYNYEEGGWRWQ